MGDQAPTVEILHYELKRPRPVRKIQMEDVFTSAVWTLITGFTLLLVIGFLMALVFHCV